MGKRFEYWLLGFAIGLLVAVAVSASRGRGWLELTVLDGIFAMNAGTVAMVIAERRGKVKSMLELDRPLTLFPREGPPK